METITLAGRKFLGISQSLSANQDDYIHGHLRRAGVIDTLTGLDGQQRTQEERAEELVTRLLLSYDQETGMGRKYFVLAGVLTEEGKTWTRAEADRNAAAFAAITDLEEKTEIQRRLVATVINFFFSGGRSSESSRKSSSPSAKVPRTKSAAR